VKLLFSEEIIIYIHAHTHTTAGQALENVVSRGSLGCV